MCLIIYAASGKRLFNNARRGVFVQQRSAYMRDVCRVWLGGVTAASQRSPRQLAACPAHTLRVRRWSVAVAVRDNACLLAWFSIYLIILSCNESMAGRDRHRKVQEGRSLVRVPPSKLERATETINQTTQDRAIARQTGDGLAGRLGDPWRRPGPGRPHASLYVDVNRQ